MTRTVKVLCIQTVKCAIVMREVMREEQRTRTQRVNTEQEPRDRILTNEY